MENNTLESEETKDPEKHHGTWFWFALNMILFPGPAYFSLLGIKSISLAKSFIHASFAIFLILLIIAAAAMQIIMPSVGTLWMFIPLISGIITLYFCRPFKSEFQPITPRTISKRNYFTLLILLVIFLVYNILPELDLIAINEAKENLPETNIQNIPLWQDSIIMLIGAMIFLGGYLINTSRAFSINRSIILFTIFLLICTQFIIIFELTYGFLKLTGGVGTILGIVLFSAVLTVDYYDASTFGQYTRRFFLLTCTKGLSFSLLWLCFLGLPQKSASLYATRAYNDIRPIVTQISYKDFIFPYHNRFTSEHEAHRRLRSLFSQAILDGNQKRLIELEQIVLEAQRFSLQRDSDIHYLQKSLSKRNGTHGNFDLDSLPFFRPVEVEWDIMLTAIMMQNDLMLSDLDQSIVDFKSSLPKASQGQLPNIDNPYLSRYVASATEMQVDFIQPNYKQVENLVAKKLVPVLSLSLSGSNYWAALVHIDHTSGLAWVRMQSTTKLEKEIRLKFDADESQVRRKEILSRQYVPLSIDYLVKQIDNMTDPIIVYTKEGLESILPEHFTQDTQESMNEEVANREQQQNATDIINGCESPVDYYKGYAGYLQSMAHVKYLLTPKRINPKQFLDESQQVPLLSGTERLECVANILSHQGTVKDKDRMDVVYKLAVNNHIAANPELFIKLAKTPPITSDFVGCNRAFIIGRSLYLLGQYQSALSYFTISSFRHPFNSEYEVWYRIALLKIGKPVPKPMSPPSHQPNLNLYYLTILDFKNNSDSAAKKRLEAALKRDSHNILANQLMYKYFDRPLDEDFFFQASEGL